MRTIETEFAEADARTLAKIALELDPSVRAYAASDLAGIDWVAFGAAPGAETTCTICGETFTHETNCPECDAPRVTKAKPSTPYRFTVQASQSGELATIMIDIPRQAREDDRPLDDEMPLADTLIDLLSDVEHLQEAEERLARETGGYFKEADTLESVSLEEEVGASEDSNDPVVGLMKIWFVVGAVLGVGVLIFILLSMVLSAF